MDTHRYIHCMSKSPQLKIIMKIKFNCPLFYMSACCEMTSAFEHDCKLFILSSTVSSDSEIQVWPLVLWHLFLSKLMILCFI